MIYFDHNATTPLDPDVLEVMLPFLTTFYGNPSSLHRHGRVVKTAIEQARQQIADLVNVNADQVIFTSGGTEANNLAISAATCTDKKQVLVGATEHPSVMSGMERLMATDFDLQTLPVDSSGTISTVAIEHAITNETGFISVMLANNETGVIQDISLLAQSIQDKGIVLHTDAIQAAGKIAVNFDELNVNLMSLSAHKIYGPKGVGALIHDKNTRLSPLLMGGGQEFGLRPGTENVAAIIGFGKAAELARQQLDSRSAQTLELREHLERGVGNIRGVKIVGSDVTRLPNTSQILFEQVDGEMLLMQLDQKSIAVSSGSACSSNSKQPSPVLSAMAYDETLTLSAIRVSLGQQNTLSEVDEFIATLKSTVET